MSEVVNTIKVGDMFAGYRIESLLGRGGMGAVYLATHERLHRRAALKVMIPELADDETFRRRFIRESQLAASLEHPHVIPIYDADEVDGILYLAMRYIDGESLRSLIKERGHLATEQTVRIIKQVASALDAAHRAGLVHLDVKPANILIGDSGTHAYLCDFGLAKRTSSEGVTRTGSLLGTADYCAPEQIEGRHVDGRTDIYSLGCVLFHCLAGQPPYVRDTEIATIQAHIADPPPALSSVRPDLPRALDGVIVTSMAKHPEVRFATANDLAEAFEAALTSSQATVPVTTSPHSLGVTSPSNQPQTVAYPPPPAGAHSTAPSRPLAGRKWLLAAFCLAALLIAAAVAVFALRGSGSSSGGNAPANRSSSSANAKISQIVRPLVPLQERLNSSIMDFSAGHAGVNAVRASASSLRESTLRAEGQASVIAPGSGPDERAARSALTAALVKQAAYAGALGDLSSTSMSPGQASALAKVASRVDGAYTVLSDKTGAQMPLARPAAQTLQSLARRNGGNAQLAAFVNRIENLVGQSASGRKQLGTALTAGYACTAAPGDVAQQAASVADNRQSILDQLGSLQTQTPQESNIVNLLQNALIQSIEADRHYRDWFASQTGCPPVQTQDQVLAQEADMKANAAKLDFVTAFNPLASKLHERTWSDAQF
jgi:serine/threonine protein kinase